MKSCCTARSPTSYSTERANKTSVLRASAQELSDVVTIKKSTSLIKSSLCGGWGSDDDFY